MSKNISSKNNKTEVKKEPTKEKEYVMNVDWSKLKWALQNL